MTAMLEVRGLHAYYGESHVLQGVDLTIEAGHAVSLVGRNGAGKTTTLSAIAGFLRPRRGVIRIGGVDVTGVAAHRVAHAGVALKLVEEVGVALAHLRAGGLTILLVEQNLALASAVGERMYVMNKGAIVFSGAAAELAAAREIETRYLGI